MNKILLAIALAIASSASLNAQSLFTTRFEESNGRESATWQETIEYYKQLDAAYDNIQIERVGSADGGYPLHVVYYTTDGNYNKAHWHRDGKIIMLINNAIHPGEPDGIDASMMLLRNAANGKLYVPDNVVLAVIPVYNIGGALNRGPHSRANQNGPEQYGFRGNAQNLDLNRDFIKCDAAETRAFQKLFTALDPDVFIDNHVSDGADYQHIMTLLATQKDKLGGQVAKLMATKFTPALYKDMKKEGYDMVPYVNDFSNTPQNGWRAFFETPRFGSGYAALFQTLAYVPETHMLKPFKQRVEATYVLMECMIKEAGKYSTEIKEARNADRIALAKQKEFVLEWKCDTSVHDNITFAGYASGYKPSEVSGQPRLYYDQNKPYAKTVPFYDHFVPVRTVCAPAAYIVPRAWKNIVTHLKRNGADVITLPHDTTIKVTAYYIDNYENGNKPYEKHYLHRNIQVHPEVMMVKCVKGDYLVKLNQPAKRYLVETLEPTSPDGFLAWNFFDGLLQQKEYFSDYVFEDLAADMLKKDPALRGKLDEKRRSDTAFAKNGAAQLEFVYRHSEFMEPSYMRYPIFRIEL